MEEYDMNELAAKETVLSLVDTHCHLDLERYFPDCQASLDRSRVAGVTDLILAGVDRNGWQRMVALSRRYPGVHAAPGMHPMYLDNHRPGDLEFLMQLVQEEHVVALGEIGLDYHIANADRSAQQKLFEAQIDIAVASRLPLLLHVRKAHDQVLATLRRKRFTGGGIVHAFNGSLQQAEHFTGLGFMVGICGTITYDRALKIRRVAAALPLQTLVLETDAPDIPPANHWGEWNAPEFLPEILAALAEIRSEGLEAIARQTTMNARRVLGLG
jgi:TatD DNase family protein